MRPLFLLFPVLAVVSHLCSSCTGTHSQGADMCQYNISHSASQEDKVRVSVAKVTPLVTDNETPIHSVTKFVSAGGDMYIFDRRMQSIYVFDSAGQQKSYINRQGAGPGEYISANDFSIDENLNLYVADAGAQRIIRYDYPDYKKFEVYPIGRAFMNIAVSGEWFYLSYLSEGEDLKIKLAARTFDNDSLRVLSEAKVDNEYQAAGGGFTHLWKSDSQLMFYDRFTPFIYRLDDGGAEKYIRLDDNDIPDEELIGELITLPTPQRYAKAVEHTDKIIDISACYETSRYIMMEIMTVPVKFVVINKESGEYARLPYLLTKEMKSSIGLIGKCGDYFVTASTGNQEQNPEIVFLNVTDN